MNSKTFWIIAALVVLLAGYSIYISMKPSALPPAQNTAQVPGPQDGFDPKNATYSIEGNFVSVFNGEGRLAQPGSAAQIVTQYFGNDAKGDLNGDGREDVVFLLTQNTGGSGTFYYAIAAINLPYGYRTTDAVLIGDRIAPQATTIANGEVTISYADRRPNEPMSATPSIGVSKVFTFDPAGKLVEKK